MVKTYRTFAGNEVVAFTKATIAFTGAFTFLTLIRLNAAGDAAYNSMFGGNNSGAFAWQFSRTPANVIQVDPGTGGSTFTLVGADGWLIVGVTKAAGSVAPRAHIFKAGAWTHQNFGSAQSDLPTWNEPRVGWSSATDPLNADVHWTAAWNSELTDGNIEGILSGGFMDDFALSALAPDALWYFDQAAVGTSVSDLTGHGNDQSSRTGTAVSSGDIPLYSTKKIIRPNVSNFPKTILRREYV